MGVLATHHIGHRNGAEQEAGAENADEVTVLAEIIWASAGTGAHEVSARLVEKFGSIAGMMARSAELRDLEPAVPANVISSLQMMERALVQGWRDIALNHEVLSTSASLHKYLQMDMSRLREEHFRVLFLNGDNRLLDDRMMWKGTVDRVQAHPREIVKVAIERGSTALILVHNHPSGDVRPSKQDLMLTEKVITACEALDIDVHDHLIIGPTRTYSIRTQRQMSPWT